MRNSRVGPSSGLISKRCAAIRPDNSFQKNETRQPAAAAMADALLRHGRRTKFENVRRSAVVPQTTSWQPRIRSRMQYQLLNSPVQELGDIQHILGRAGDLVDPAELLELLAGFAEHSKNFAVEREFVYAPR